MVVLIPNLVKSVWLHHGVLFLDELPEFDRKVLEVLREPLESGQVVISRAAKQMTFPAAFSISGSHEPLSLWFWVMAPHDVVVHLSKLPVIVANYQAHYWIELIAY